MLALVHACVAMLAPNPCDTLMCHLRMVPKEGSTKGGGLVGVATKVQHHLWHTTSLAPLIRRPTHTGTPQQCLAQLLG